MKNERTWRPGARIFCGALGPLLRPVRKTDPGNHRVQARRGAWKRRPSAAVRRTRGALLSPPSSVTVTRPDKRCPMTMKDEYLRLMRGLIGGMAIAVALVCSLIAAVAIVVS